MKKTLIILRRALFVLLLAALLLFANTVFLRKTTGGAWNYTTKVGGFFNEPEEVFDILAFGSSHMYCTLSPNALKSSCGLDAYVLATQQQPLSATRVYIREALRHQSPKVVLIEAYMALIDDAPAAGGVAHDAVDPFPDGFGKLTLIRSMDTEGEKTEYLFPFLKYHTRWKELTAADYRFSAADLHDPMQGYVFLTDAEPNENAKVDYTQVEEGAIPEAAERELNDILTLVREAGSEPVLLLSPLTAKPEILSRAKALHRFAEENAAPLIDLNEYYDEMGLDNQTDFYDSGHLNVWGAEKASAFLGERLTGDYALTPSDDVSEARAQDLAYYETQKQASLETQ